MLTKDRMRELLQKHMGNTLSPAEREELFAGLEAGEQSGDWKSIIAELGAESDIPYEYDEKAWAPVIQSILQSQAIIKPIQPRSPAPFLKKIGWAAAVLFLFSMGILFWQQHRQATRKSQAQVVPPTAKPIEPGSTGAILTLSDGRQVILDSLGNGLITTENETAINLKDGRVQYAPQADITSSTAVAYNTLTTPKGRQFQLELPDGSKVWLNAASSITYPARFTGKERHVTINGEAYFEVAKNAALPFKVTTGKVTVEVLGTHFNINAYDDEASINTTLLEGSVKINTQEIIQLLQPGQQAQVRQNAIQLVKNADVDQAVAWKNGVFSFAHAGLPAVMRQLSRWYNVEVVYAGAVPVREFTGDIGRTLTWEQVLRILAKNKINFRMENSKRIVILP